LACLNRAWDFSDITFVAHQDRFGQDFDKFHQKSRFEGRKKVDQKAEKNQNFAKTVSTPPTTVWHT
jgi:hypothetical protein